MNYPRSHAPRQMWTEAQDQVIRDLYVPKGALAVAALTGKSPSGIAHRAKRLNVCRKRRWTAREKERLEVSWGTLDLPEICVLLNRPKGGVYAMALEMGLTGEPPQGYELLSYAAKRTGFNPETLVKILARSSFSIRPVTTLGKNRDVPRDGQRDPKKKGYRHWLVDSTEVDIAVDAWFGTEVLGTAARRTGVDDGTLRRWLVDAGVTAPAKRGRGCYWRLPTETIDRVVAERLNGTDENVQEAAKRVGLSCATMSVWLKAAGALGKRPYRVDPAVVDRVVAERRSRSSCRNLGRRGSP